MAWRQLVPFDPSKMGTKPGYCLQNVRLGFGIKSKYYDAKEAMEANKNEGTLHDIDTLPTNVSVPVFIDVTSPYEHVITSDKGIFYSDGKKLSSLKGLKVFGWGETLNGVRVVEFVEEPKPVEPDLPPVDVPDKPAVLDYTGKTVVPTRLVDVNGTKLKQYDVTYTVTQDSGDTVVLSARGAVWARLNKKDVRLV